MWFVATLTINLSSDIVPPSVPRNLHVVSTDEGQIFLAWQSPKEKVKAPVEGYVIEMAIGHSKEFVEIDRVDGKTHNFSAAGLKSGQKYNFRIKSENSSGTSSGAQLEKAVAACPPSVGKLLPHVNVFRCICNIINSF